VPIVQNLHWSIAAVAHLDTIEERAREYLNHGRDIHQDTGAVTPSIIFMDSLRLHPAETIARNLRNYLRAEWVARGKRARQQGESIHSDTTVDAAVDVLLERMKLVRPAVPEQDNLTDCGLFALQYAEEVIVRWPECREDKVEGITADMFTVADMKKKREALKGLVDRLHHEYDGASDT